MRSESGVTFLHPNCTPFLSGACGGPQRRLRLISKSYFSFFFRPGTHIFSFHEHAKLAQARPCWADSSHAQAVAPAAALALPVDTGT